MQRLPFQDGWAFARDPGLPIPVEEDGDDFVLFEEPPASPDPSSAATSVYEITASGVVSESSSIPTSGLPTPPPSAGPPVPIDVLIRKAAERLQEAAPIAAPDAGPDAPDADPDAPGAAPYAPDAVPEAAEDAAPASDRAAIVTPPSTPLRRSARLAERAQREAEVAARAHPVEAVVHPRPRRVAKMSTGGVRKN